MSDGRICRSTIMSLAFTVAHDPQIDGDFAHIYCTQTDGPIMYYKAIQDVLVAHKFLALPRSDRERLDPMLNAFNLKDARAGEYIKQMVHLYPPSLYSPSIDAVFDVIGEMKAVAVVHCGHDTPYKLALVSDPAARMIFNGRTPAPQYLEAFKVFLKASSPCDFRLGALHGQWAQRPALPSTGNISTRCSPTQPSGTSILIWLGDRSSPFFSSTHLRT